MDYIRNRAGKTEIGIFNVLFSKNYDRNKITDEDEIMKNYKEMQMDQKEREKFELYLISNPFVTPEIIYITSRG